MADYLQEQEICVRSGLESCLLLMPGIGAQQIIGEDVGVVRVGVRDRKARTAGTVDVLGPGFGAEFVFSVRLYRDELNELNSRDILSIEGYGERSRSAVKLIVSIAKAAWGFDSYHQSNPPFSKFSSNPPFTIRFSREGRYG